MYELIHTSTPQGLIAGRSGFASVAFTEGIPANLISPVEALSAYKPLFPPGNPEASKNPVVYSSQRIVYGAVTLQIVSRIGAAGFDYTGRSNKIAHHLIFDHADELEAIPFGAISVARESSNFITKWNEPARLLPKRSPKFRPPARGIAETWRKLTGDAGWAGVVAETFRENPDQAFHVEFPIGLPGETLLELVAEIIPLLNREEVPLFTFSTCFSFAGSESVFFRATPENAPQWEAIKRLKPNAVLSLVEAPGAVPERYEASRLVKLARDGVKPEAAPDFPEPQARSERQEIVLKTETKPEGIPLSPPSSLHKQDAVPQPDQKKQESAKQLSQPCFRKQGETRDRFRRKCLFASILLLLSLTFTALAIRFRKSGTEDSTEIAVSLQKAEPLQKPELPLPAEEESDGGAPASPEEQEKNAEDWPCDAHSRLRTGLALFLEWSTGENEIRLPRLLRTAERISVEIETVGNVANLTERQRFLTVDAEEARILAARRISASRFEPAADVPASQLHLSLRNGCLELVLPSRPPEAGLELPARRNITGILFGRGEETFRFETRFLPEYIPLLPPGKIVGSVGGGVLEIKFLPAPETLLLRRHLTIQIGKRTLSSLDNGRELEVIRLPLQPFQEWNQRVAEFRNCKAKSDAKAAEYRLECDRNREILNAKISVPPLTDAHAETYLTPEERNLAANLFPQKGDSDPLSDAELLLQKLNAKRKAAGTDEPEALRIFREALEKSIHQMRLQKKIDALRIEAEELQTKSAQADQLLTKAADSLLHGVDLLEDALGTKSGLQQTLQTRQTIDPATLASKLAESLLPPVITPIQKEEESFHE